jgi:hypothetical protein
MPIPVPVIDGVINLATSVIDRLFPDPVKQEAARFEMFKLQQSGELAQIVGQLEINKEEAKSSNFLIAGARPFIMWGCGFAMLYAALFEPFMRFIAVVYFKYSGAFPVIDTTITTQVLFALLGLGVYRTAEKIKGAEGNR